MQGTVLESIVTGVYVLTVQHQGQINGTTVAWVTPVAYDPMLVMVSLADIRVSHGLVKQSGYFGLNSLSTDQVEQARHFGFTTARDTNKFEGVGYSTSDSGIPVLDGVRAYIECRLVDSFPAGDHTMFVGEVVAAQSLNGEAEPLIFKQEDYF
jgi:flavin reductase (DIM6/NTAB) family NADH-FMN oxidoreductase RutF